jgi:predicted acetyltransferase
MFLSLPSAEYKESYVAALKEYRAEGRHEGKHLEHAEADFEGLLRSFQDEAEGRNLPEGYVPQTTFWLIDNQEYVGEARIRHTLTDKLKAVGGHIGYAIRPSKRNMGYGKKVLELALPKARELGIREVLLTCDASNVGSRKIIEANGGEFENEVPGENGPKRRYWFR